MNGVEVFVAVLAAQVAYAGLRRAYGYMENYGYHHGRWGEGTRWRIRSVIRPVVGWKR